MAWIVVSGSICAFQPVAADERTTDLTAELVRNAFIASSDGYSSDELLVRDSLRQSFLNQIAEGLGQPVDAATERQALLKLLGLRKAGKLKHPATRRAPPAEEIDFVVAEIASRAVMDRHRVTTDTILADPKLRDELQLESEKVASDVDAYAIRKAVLSLRKRRQLKPELVLKAVDWPRVVRSMRLKELQAELEAKRIPRSPGIYLFRDATGYLYIGEADNLAVRLEQHTSDSDRKSLAAYLTETNSDEITVELHIFPSDSPAKKVAARRAYESELIRSRTPKFNVRP